MLYNVNQCAMQIQSQPMQYNARYQQWTATQYKALHYNVLHYTEMHTGHIVQWTVPASTSGGKAELSI